MKPPPFEYRRPASLAEALEILGSAGDDARPLAGGQSLIPLLAMRLARPSLLVDLQRVPELRGIQAGGGLLRVGAMIRQAELERTSGLPEVVAAALPHVGHFQIRSRGTVGGSLAHMDPAAEWPALALLLDADLEAASVRGRRTIPAAEFALGPLTTALAPDELLVSLTVRYAGGPFGFEELERRPGDFALAGAACHRGRVVVFATGGRPQRLPRCEAYVRQGGRAGPELREVAEAEIEATGDLHVSAAYRRRVGARLVERAVVAAS
ncbi:MAG TPA: FAD binding domain-containing protein [Candidatus Dormibacteraeota bacterium]|nr:FAD binding domain-containing protein [Candidatus Dormibacteraeota bacterium]